jgi:hypothetical protein
MYWGVIRDNSNKKNKNEIVMSTPITTTIVNVVFNPYQGKRPKHPDKMYDMDVMFDKLSKRSFPIVIRNNSDKQVEKIVINAVYACLPGGRGCLGKERMGTQLQNRQIAMLYNKGFMKNPSHTNKNIGFIQLSGFVEYKDGKIGNISIPVETSGVVGLRAGGMIVNPSQKHKNNAINVCISEIETHILSLLKIKKIREYKIVMINGIYNLYTKKLKKNRPRISDYMKFLKILYTNGLNEHYKKPTMPWQNRQGAPSVVKAIFRSDTLPTLMISPFGHCEVMGASSFEDIVKVYKLSISSFDKIKNNINFDQPVESTKPNMTYKLNKEGGVTSVVKSRTYTKRGKINISIFNNNIETINGKVFIKKKPCDKFPKHVLKKLAEDKGLMVKGTKDELCKRLFSLF